MPVCSPVWYSSQLTAAEGKTVNWESHCCVLVMEGGFYVNMLICTFVFRQTSRNLVLFSKNTSSLHSSRKTTRMMNSSQNTTLSLSSLHSGTVNTWAPQFFLYCSWKLNVKNKLHTKSCMNEKLCCTDLCGFRVSSLLHFLEQPQSRLEVCWLVTTPSYVCSIAL